MKRLRLLIFDNVVLSTAIGYLSNELRLIDLPGYQFPTLPFNSGLKQLVILNMPHNHIHQFGKGSKNFERLKVLNLSHSKFLRKIPDLSTAPNLESLHVDHCTSLTDIHESVGFLTKLVILDAQHCSNLSTVPSNLSHLSACGNLVHIPSSIYKLVFLDVLDLNYCTSLYEFPNHVQEIDGDFVLSMSKLQNCNIPKEDFLVTPFSFPLLQHLVLSGNKFATLPSAHKLWKFSDLSLANCILLREIPELPERQINLKAGDYESLVETVWNMMTKIIPNDMESDSRVGSLRRESILIEPGDMWLIYLPASTLLSECLPYSPFKEMSISIRCGIHVLWDQDELMIEQKRIKVSDTISHIVERTFDDFAHGGIQFSWSSQQKRAGVSGRNNMFEIEDFEEEEEVANISETEGIIDKTFDDFANEGNQFSWSSQEKRASVSARTNIFEIETWKRKRK
ncbi:hypothetical protein FEM48_Zijuj05G0176100 [Ziziphus jujuba var. spinosa]|uniref:Uncharacterized protein n=1 Tax=Ziziphus jujuba var. spinosa TaxID=714518 RepID=A0A978VG72_ZIZJJ|nr:hypothetical protein FEM48_Zijuj05G0176100 [Ziziphus jujuba var. spinosa]